MNSYPHLFSPLPHEGHASGARSGLGLLIVREIVLAHGGTIDVRSGAEEGTAFEIWLPRTTVTPG